MEGEVIIISICVIMMMGWRLQSRQPVAGWRGTSSTSTPCSSSSRASRPGAAEASRVGLAGVLRGARERSMSWQ